jgi:Skp family chaperone for outer membrane proteins
MFRTISAIVLLTVLATLSHAQQKIAVVDETIIMKEYKGIIKADSELKVLATRWNDTATAYEKMLKQKADDFRARSASMKTTERQPLMDTIAAMQQALAGYRSNKAQQPNGEYWKERAKRYDPLIAKYKQAVALVAKRENIDLVFNKGGVSYNNAPDLTQKVLKELKELK